MEGADGLGQALFDGHPPGVTLDELLRGGGPVVGDEHGGGLPAEAGDDQLADGAGIGGQRGVLFEDSGAAVGAVAVQAHGAPGGGGHGGDVAGQAPGSASAG